MAILEYFGLLDNWVLILVITLGVCGLILYFDIVSGLVCIDFEVDDSPGMTVIFTEKIIFVSLVFKENLTL